jgi:hypothetical protein
MSHPKHPLIAADRANTAPDLIGERLEGEAMVGGGERAAQSIAWTVGFLGVGKQLDCFSEAALE